MLLLFYYYLLILLNVNSTGAISKVAIFPFIALTWPFRISPCKPNFVAISALRYMCFHHLIDHLWSKVYSHFSQVFLEPPTNRPLTTDHLPTNQLTTSYRPTNHQQLHRPPTSKKSEDQKKFQFIFGISYVIQSKLFEIMLCIMHTHYLFEKCCCMLICVFFFCFQGRI